MPQPMNVDDNGAAQPAVPTPQDSPLPRSPEQDSSGRALAVQLPDWDLLPPTEFLQRNPGR